MEELAFKSLAYDEYSSNRVNNDLEQDEFVNSIQEKLLRMQVDYAKRLKIKEICYKKKFSDLQKNIKELVHQMDVSFVLIYLCGLRNTIECVLGLSKRKKRWKWHRR